MPTSSASVKGLVRLGLLEQVSPALLVRFLRPFEQFLNPRGVNLDTDDPSTPWIAHLHAVLTRVDPEMPGTLLQALLDVADLANEQGHEHAIDVAGERQLSLFRIGAELSPEDLAFRLYLEHGEVFAASHARVQSQEARRFVSYRQRVALPFSGYLTEAKRVLLVSQLRRWFGARNRSDFVDLRVSEDDQDVTFLIIHGRAPRSLSVITSPFSRDRMSFIPDKQDTVVYHRANGRLSVNAQFPAENDFYRRLFGTAFFGDNDHFQERRLLSGEVLLEHPQEALDPSGVPGLSAVTLREVGLAAVQPPFDTLLWKATDLKSLLRGELPALLRRERVVSLLKLNLHLTGHRRAKLVEIVPPNKLTFDRRVGEDVVREFLISKGFMALTDEQDAQRDACA